MINKSNDLNSVHTEKQDLVFWINKILNKIRWWGLGLGWIVFLINWIFFTFYHKDYIKFVELHFSPDGFISQPEKIIIIVLTTIILMSLSWMVITSQSSVESLKSSIESWPKLSKLNKFLYFLVFGILASFYLVRRIYPYLYIEDGFFESLTVVLALIASLLCLVSIYSNHDYVLLKLVLFILFFLFGMEEISWGQRIFGWGTPVALSNINHQNETNIHNFFNPYFKFLYPLFNLLLGCLILSSLKLRKKVAVWLKMEKYLSFIPTPEFKLYGIIFILLNLTFQSYLRGGELIEEIISVFILAYAFNLPGKKKTTQ